MNAEHLAHLQERDFCKEAKQEFLKEQTSCPVCEGPLEFFIQYTSFVTLKEEMRCTQCSAMAGAKAHIIH